MNMPRIQINFSVLIFCALLSYYKTLNHASPPNLSHQLSSTNASALLKDFEAKIINAAKSGKQDELVQLQKVLESEILLNIIKSFNETSVNVDPVIENLVIPNENVKYKTKSREKRAIGLLTSLLGSSSGGGGNGGAAAADAPDGGGGSGSGSILQLIGPLLGSSSGGGGGGEADSSSEGEGGGGSGAILSLIGPLLGSSSGGGGGGDSQEGDGGSAGSGAILGLVTSLFSSSSAGGGGDGASGEADNGGGGGGSDLSSILGLSSSSSNSGNAARLTDTTS